MIIQNLKKWSLKEIEESGIDSEHWDYVGRGKYVLDKSPHAYMNHSCDPNCIIKHENMKVKYVYARRDIKKGEELTHDYAAGAFDIFGKKDPYAFKCHCGSKSCRKIVSRNFFELPKKLQKEYYKYLPPSIKRKYRKYFKKLFSK